MAATTPFNFPLILAGSKLAPALAAGNTVVHKPADETPLSALCMAGLLQRAGVPDGVVNVITGTGPIAGEALLRHAGVDKIAFTGSTAVDRHPASVAGENLTPVTMELGGNAAHLVFEDADLERAVGAVIKGFVFNTGQFCMGGPRLLVARANRPSIAPLGSGVQTGVGAVWNVIEPRLDDAIVVLGAGAVGVSAAMGAALTPATTVIAVDVLRQGADALTARGTLVVVGAPPFGSEVALDVDGLLPGKRIVGLTLGDSETQSFIPALVGLVKAGRLPLHRLVTAYPFADIDQAVRDMSAGQAIKPVLTF